MYLMCGAAAMMIGMQNIASVLLSADVEHWCYVPRLQNFSHDQQRQIAIPFDEDDDADYDHEKCKAFNYDWDNFTDEQLLSWDRNLVPEDMETVDCNRVVYKLDPFKSTIVNEVGN